MSHVPDFPTPEMLAAERELDRQIEASWDVIREAEAELEAFELEQKEEVNGDEDLPPMTGEELEALIGRYALTPQWQAVIEKIDQGTLTWDEVAEIINSGDDNELVNAAADSIATLPPEALEAMANDYLESASGPEAPLIADTDEEGTGFEQEWEIVEEPRDTFNDQR